MSLQVNLMMGRRAIKEVQTKLMRGSSNQSKSTSAGRSAVTSARADLADLLASGSHATIAKLAAQTARWSAGGNCAEQASVAFDYLHRHGIVPLDIMGYDRYSGLDHCWVVIGRPDGAEDRWFDHSWGKDAVICDPWKSICIAASQMDTHYSSAKYEVQTRVKRPLTKSFEV